MEVNEQMVLMVIETALLLSNRTYLIRTFMADATKDAAVYEISDEQAQKKKM